MYLMNTSTVWKSPEAKRFSQVLSCIDDIALMQAFLRDVMTEKEIREVSTRLKAAALLRAGYTYDQIVKETRLSTRTVARIRDWMDNGAGGYQAILSGDHAHTPPVDVG